MFSCTITRLLLAAAGLLLAMPALAQVAKVNGVSIPQSRMEIFMRDLAAQGRPDTPEVRNLIKQELISRELMAQEAVRRGLDKTPDTTAQMDVARQNVLARAYLQETAKANQPSEDALKKEYERIKAQLGTKEYKARHILVDQEAEAREILAQVKKGGNFAKIAAEKSMDNGTKGNGGALDWAVPTNYVKPFADALVKLKKGQITDAPVKSDFGWHIIQLEDERALKVPTYEEVKPNLQQQLQRQAQEKAINDLRAKAKIE
jgi:peptidyl-prolyl cis-trans isomerase C